MGIFNFGRKDPKDQPSKDQPPKDTPAASTPAGSADGAEKPRGLLDRLKAGLAKTAQVLRTDVRDLFKREGRLVDEDFLEELRGILVRTDMGPAAAEAIVDDVRERLRARVVDPEVVLDSIRTQLLARLRNTEAGLTMAVSGPTVILVTGVNGSGKTTSIAKLARMFTRDGKRVVLGAGDTFRAAAVEQLTMWADRLGAEIVRGPQGSDPASVAHKAVATSASSTPPAASRRNQTSCRSSPRSAAWSPSSSRTRPMRCSSSSMPPPAKTPSRRPRASRRPPAAPGSFSPSSTARPAAA